MSNRQVIWFRAEVPVRQWNSMCLIRKFRQKFQIYQNNENVYSYGECRTVGPINDYYPTQVKDKPCHDKPQWRRDLIVIKWQQTGSSELSSAHSHEQAVYSVDKEKES